MEILDIHCAFGATPTSPEWGDIRAIESALQARGINSAFLASDLARRFDLVVGNEQVAEALALAPAMRAWLVIHPARAVEVNVQMRRFLYDPRFVGCALYADPMTGKPITLRAIRELLNAFRRFAKPLLIEVATVEAMQEAVAIAQEMSSMKVIVSGMGGDEWRDVVDMAVAPLNLSLDFAGVLTADKIDYAIRTLGGVRKLVFGSGAPGTDPAAVIGLLDDLDISAEDRERLLGLSALRLFNLGAAAEVESIELNAPAAASAEEAVVYPTLETLE